MEEENERILEFARQQQKREEDRMEKKKQQEEGMAAVQTKVGWTKLFCKDCNVEFSLTPKKDRKTALRLTIWRHVSWNFVSEEAYELFFANVKSWR